MIKTSEAISLDDVNRCSKLIGIISDVGDGVQQDILIGQTTAYAMGLKAGMMQGIRGAGDEKRQDIS